MICALDRQQPQLCRAFAVEEKRTLQQRVRELQDDDQIEEKMSTAVGTSVCS